MLHSLRDVVFSIVGSALGIGLVLLVVGKRFGRQLEGLELQNEEQLRRLDMEIRQSEHVATSDAEAAAGAGRTLNEAMLALSTRRFDVSAERHLANIAARDGLRQRFGSEHPLNVACSEAMHAISACSRQTLEWEMEA